MYNYIYVLLHDIHPTINIFSSYNTEKQQTHERQFLWIELNTSNQFDRREKHQMNSLAFFRYFLNI